jgi:hypothetical protein
MALQISKKLSNNMTATEAYVKIIGVNFSQRRGDEIVISCHFFADKAARDANAGSIHGDTYRYDHKADDPIANAAGEAISPVKFAYKKLKADPEFASALDV